MPVRAQSPDGDDGFTLVEVIVAMLVLAIVMTGFLYTVTASLTATRDTRARVVAANLASQQIDVLRSVDSVFAVTNTSHVVELNGDTFRVQVDWGWGTPSGGTASCEAGSADDPLAYKHVTVEVSWDGGTKSVFSDTVLTPRTKINDPDAGTVLVGVLDADGIAVSGATVRLSPTGVAATTTDSEGCAYLLRVPAAAYTVDVSKPGYISDLQVGEATATVNVTPGDTSRLSFTLERAALFTVVYAGNASPGALIPNNLTTSFLSTYGSFQMASDSSAKTKTFEVYPVSSGYSIVAGTYAETPENAATRCLAPDPGEWLAGAGKIGTRPVEVGAEPGISASAAVSMGEIKLQGANGSNLFNPRTHLKAVYVGGGAGDPGCARGMELTFGDVIVSNNATIALPYGTWKLYRGNSTEQATQITSGITVPSNGSVSSGVVVLDPRVTP